MARKGLIFLVLMIVILWLMKRKDMSWKQSLVKTIYPLFVLKDKWFPKASYHLENKQQQVPAVSFYSLQAISNTGDTVHFEKFKGKQVLIVNTASDCGYTPQYEELEAIHRQFPALEILAFPANDFKQQEKKSDAEIATFCKVNYGVTFPLMKKVQVVKGASQDSVFNWLSDPNKNGWCKRDPVWNFSKYLISADGVLQHYFAPQIQPSSDVMRNAITSVK